MTCFFRGNVSPQLPSYVSLNNDLNLYQPYESLLIHKNSVQKQLPYIKKKNIKLLSYFPLPVPPSIITWALNFGKHAFSQCVQINRLQWRRTKMNESESESRNRNVIKKKPYRSKINSHTYKYRGKKNIQIFSFYVFLYIEGTGEN